MDFNRPIIEEEEKGGSSRGSSANTDANQMASETPIDENYDQRHMSESQLDQLEEHNEEENDQTNQLINEIAENNNQDLDNIDHEQTLGEHEIDTDGEGGHQQLDETNPDEKTIDESQDNQTPNLENAEKLETEAAAPEQEHHDSHEKKDGGEVTHHKKEAVKRKTRQANKFADGNLIPEEGDDEQYDRVKSPGPPPLEPISQVLDRDHDKHHEHHHLKHDPDLLGATTPDKIDVTLDEDYQEIEVEIKPTREELIARYQTVIEERERLQNANNQLHHKLADYFRKRKSEEAQNQPLFDKSSQEQEQRYVKYLSTIESLKKQLERKKLESERHLDELKQKCETRREIVDQDRIHFTKIKMDTGVRSISSQTGKPFTSKELEAYLERERQKESEVITVRIENLKLKIQLKKKEDELKAKEEFGDGLHMIDFEQLKIENQTYNEKIEERNEELMKLRKKINNTVQILTHVKEKLQFVTVENDKEKQRLSAYDDQVKKNRDVLNKIKQSRDSLRMDNARLKQNSGLLGNTVLLRDFEECVDKNDNLELQIEHLKRKHAELVLNSKGIKQKISQAKADKNIA